MNWYRPARWILWARAASDVMPIIQSNGPIESHWGVLKKWHLQGSSCPTPSLTCCIIMELFLPDRFNRIAPYRLGRIQSSAEQGFVRDWRSAAARNRDELQDGGRIRLMALRARDRDEYGTDVSVWYCRCPAFSRNLYHVCKYLVRALPCDFVPVSSEVH